jgi:predicted metal-dependent hydrolase
VHVAVAWLHAGRGNEPGCRRQLQKAARRLERYRPAHRGVDVERVLAQVADAERTAARGDLLLPRVEI